MFIMFVYDLLITEFGLRLTVQLLLEFIRITLVLSVFHYTLHELLIYVFALGTFDQCYSI